VQSSVPIIYTPNVQRATVPWTGRVTAGLVAAAMFGVLAIAVSLRPSPKGIGTHEGMGFHGCDFLTRTGLPCPSCGMTTSFAWFVRGNWIASFYVQPMGFVLAIITGTVFWAALYIALTGRPIQRLLRQMNGAWMIAALMGFGIAAWAWKIFIHLRGMDGWH
jgi:hypothetical protein